jgi:hypothetical protein
MDSDGNSSFPEGWPANCPPQDAVDANITVYRTVKTTPPTEVDFLSYHELGKKVPEGKKCQACGISVWPTKEAAAHQRQVFEWQNPHIAEAKLAPEHGKVKDTPSRRFPEHVTWWCYAAVTRSQLFTVVQG